MAEPTARTDRGRYVHLLAGLSYGRGLRFNNPFRLSRPLGNSAESVSLTAPYLDAWGAALFGDPDGFQHGPGVHVAFALRGVPQEVIAPTYLAAYRWTRRVLVWGRFGFPIVVEPDANLGLEAGLGGAVFVLSGLGFSFETAYSLFWGAATANQARTRIPILSAQLGLVVGFEVLP